MSLTLQEPDLTAPFRLGPAGVISFVQLTTMLFALAVSNFVATRFALRYLGMASAVCLATQARILGIFKPIIPIVNGQLFTFLYVASSVHGHDSMVTTHAPFEQLTIRVAAMIGEPIN